MDTDPQNRVPALAGLSEQGLARAGWLVFAASLAYFAALTPRFPFPGQGADALCAYQGLHPFRPMASPLWGLLMTWVADVAGTRATPVANFFSAGCGALVVWLAFRIIVALPFRRLGLLQRNQPPEADSAWARLIGGLSASAYLMFALPTLIVFTRANAMSLDLLLWVGAIALSVRFRQTGRLAWWYGFTLLYGVGWSEYPAFTLSAPVFAVAWLWMLWRTRQLKPIVVATGLLLFLAGSSLFFLYAWQYYHSPAAAWREFSSYGEVLKYSLLEIYHAVRYGVPKFGWLSILILMLAPGLVVFTSGFEPADDPFTKLGQGLFKTALFLVALVPLLDLPGSPWRILGSKILVVLPYVFTAMWFGHLVGFLYYGLAQRRSSRRPLIHFVRRATRPALVCGVAALLAVAGARHVAYVNPRRTQPVIVFVDSLLGDLQGRKFLLSDGSLDSTIALRAREKGRPLVVLNRRLGRAEPYLRYLATQLEAPELRSIAVSGLQPLLDVWSRAPDDFINDVASLDYPDAWRLRGFGYLPHRGLFQGARAESEPDVPATLSDGLLFLQSWTQTFATAHAPHYGDSYTDWVSRHLSLFANNLGVFAESGGLTNEAWDAYQFARSFNPKNASALINLDAMAVRANRPEHSALQAAISNLMARHQAPGNIVQLAMEQGYVNNPEAYLREGLAWAMAGRPDLGAEKVSQGLSNTGTNAAVQFLRGRLLQADLGSGDGDESAEAYRDVLAANPRNLVALANLQRNAMLHGDVAEAKKLQDQMAKAGGSPAQLAIDRGVLHLAQGQIAEARKAFESAAAMASCPPTVWVATGVLALQEKDEKLLSHALEQLKLVPHFVPGLIFQADLSMQRGDAQSARDAYGQALDQEPLNRVALERLMTLNFLQREIAVARALAGRLLNLDADNAAANYVMGTIFFSEGANDLAEAALRRSVVSRPNGPALNDLAWLLQNQNQLDEALQFSRQAVQLVPTQPLFWGTQGLILSKQKKTAQAAEAFDQALKFGLKHPEALIVAATVFLEVQRPDDARRALAIAGEQAKGMGPSQKKAYDRLTARLADTASPATE